MTGLPKCYIYSTLLYGIEIQKMDKKLESRIEDREDRDLWE